jgi:hypothetical protein
MSSRLRHCALVCALATAAALRAAPAHVPSWAAPEPVTIRAGRLTGFAIRAHGALGIRFDRRGPGQ